MASSSLCLLLLSSSWKAPDPSPLHISHPCTNYMSFMHWSHRAMHTASLWQALLLFLGGGWKKGEMQTSDGGKSQTRISFVVRGRYLVLGQLKCFVMLFEAARLWSSLMGSCLVTLWLSFCQVPLPLPYCTRCQGMPPPALLDSLPRLHCLALDTNKAHFFESSFCDPP